MEEFADVIRDLQARVEKLETVNTITKVRIPAEGFLVLPIYASDPAAEDGKIYYNSATDKIKICENGVWKTVTTS